MAYDQDAAVRHVIRESFRELAEKLADFNQTTHTSFHRHRGLPGITECLAACYMKPDALAISNLSQTLRQFLKDSNHDPDAPPFGREAPPG
jgi:hypothetical protein